MCAKGRSARGRSDGASVQAISMMVALVSAAVGAFGLYTWLQEFETKQAAPEGAQFVTQQQGCETRVLVGSAPEPVPLRELRIAPVGGAEGTAISLEGWTARGAPWTTDAGGTLETGDALRVWSETPREFLVVHAPTDASIGRFSVRGAGEDTSPPLLAVESATTRAAALGTATDEGCSGIAHVHAVLRDDTDGTTWDGRAWQRAVATLDAQLQDAGAARTAWRIDLVGVAWQDGHVYRLHVQAQDGAGNVGEPATKTL